MNLIRMEMEVSAQRKELFSFLNISYQILVTRSFLTSNLFPRDFLYLLATGTVTRHALAGPEPDGGRVAGRHQRGGRGRERGGGVGGVLRPHLQEDERERSRERDKAGGPGLRS